MDGLTPPGSAPVPSPVPPPHDPHAASPRRVKRRLIGFLLGLHAAALLAAAGLVVRAKVASPRRTSDAATSAAKVKELLGNGDSVGWVSIRGPIYSSESGKPWEHGAEQWAHRIEQLADTKGVKAIVLDINSPGGSVGAVQEIYSRILRVKKQKHIPFVALFGDVAASGGYYIAAACDKIVAHPGTLTGSIGVIFEMSNLEGLFNKIGYKMDPIKSGAHKDIGSVGRAMTPEERAIMQALINDAYGQFVQAVADGRGMKVEDVKPLADGRVYSGTQALGNHLVDQLGDSHDALMLAAKMGGIVTKEDEEPRVRRDAEGINNLFEMLESRTAVTLGLGPVQIPLPGAMSPQQTHGMLYMWSGW
jgi:protease-4